MTKQLANAFPSLEQFLLGVQPELFAGAQFNKQDSFPRYNIIEESDPDTSLPTSVRVDLALAGYTADDLQVIVDKGMLTVGTKDDQKHEKTITHSKVVHQGITKRNFKISFNLTPQLSDVPSVTFKDGILSVKFKYERLDKKFIPIQTV